MPSELKLMSLCAYLTDVNVEWRDEDHRASKMVKALKGDPINGYFVLKIAGVDRTFDQSNIDKFLERIPRALARTIALHLETPATIVPIPNAHVTDPGDADFRTLALAKSVAAESRGKLTAVPALVFREKQQKSREGGPRSPHHFEQAYRIAVPVHGPIVLLDDVCTGGGHLIAAHWKLHGADRNVALACTFGRSTKTQQTDPIGIRLENLNLSRVG
jgi:hypothetical protein